MSEAIDHDRLFKELLSVFFIEFLELFAPDVAALVDRGSLEFLDKELFLDVVRGERREVDLVVKGRFRGRDAFFLIHVETQATRRADFAERMFLYGARLYEKHRLPIYPVAVLSCDAPRSLEPDTFTFQFGERTPLKYTFLVVQLNRLNWRDFVNRPNPVASALMAKIGMAAEERVTPFGLWRRSATIQMALQPLWPRGNRIFRCNLGHRGNFMSNSTARHACEGERVSPAGQLRYSRRASSA
ncbi:MAG: hypothetical protein NZ585_06950 [Chloracidobacterium sp.]|nr:hypothetical protein [Chloracidobacterium sp.]MDW8218427.1 hypothetical protein [Acidobacteriota bacterium]